MFTQLTAKSYRVPLLCSLFIYIYNKYTNIHIQHIQYSYEPMTTGEQRVNCNFCISYQLASKTGKVAVSVELSASHIMSFTCEKTKKNNAE